MVGPRRGAINLAVIGVASPPSPGFHTEIIKIYATSRDRRYLHGIGTDGTGLRRGDSLTARWPRNAKEYDMKDRWDRLAIALQLADRGEPTRLLDRVND